MPFWQLLFFKIIFNFYCFGIGILFDEMQETKHIKMNNEIYKKHVYDLDLKSLLLNYEKGIGQVKLKNTDKPPEYYIDQIKFSIDEYCHNKGILFENEVIVIITPEANNIYSYFLALSLIFYPKHKIRLYLNYHVDQFSKSKKSKKSFISIVEYILSTVVENSSPFDNSERLDIIMRWAEDKGVPSQNAKRIMQSDPEQTLIWDKSKNSVLKILSNKLFIKKYTKRKTDFQEVFFNNKRIDWKGSPESWVYLMYSLTRSPYAYMTTSKGVKPYLIISRQFFKFYNDEEKIYGKGTLSTMLHNITKRSEGKHGKTRADIDSILKRLIINL